MKKFINSEQGQVILILILVMTVALAIGISVIQRSLSDISTSSKVEQSSRAFSAAEAGIEKALNCPTCETTTVEFAENQSRATVTAENRVPAIPAGFGGQQALFECPPSDPRLAKEDIAQIWLADPNSPTNPPAEFYKQTSLDVYWGNSTDDKAALELTLIYYAGTQYQTKKWYLDHRVTRNPDNGFTQAACTGYDLGTTNYQCKYTIGDLPSSPSRLILLRARLLYLPNTTEGQPFAVQAVGTCSESDTSGCIPPQARILVSTGTSGQTQRTVQVCQLEKVVPPYFDYAIFSADEIEK